MRTVVFDGTCGIIDGMTDLLLITVGLGAFCVVGSIPFVLKKVRPNGWIGVRTSKTLSNDELWYKANRYAGWNYLVLGLILMATPAGICVVTGSVEPWAVAFLYPPVLLIGLITVRVRVALYVRRL